MSTVPAPKRQRILLPRTVVRVSDEERSMWFTQLLSDLPEDVIDRHCKAMPMNPCDQHRTRTSYDHDWDAARQRCKMVELVRFDDGTHKLVVKSGSCKCDGYLWVSVDDAKPASERDSDTRRRATRLFPPPLYMRPIVTFVEDVRVYVVAVVATHLPEALLPELVYEWLTGVKV